MIDSAIKTIDLNADLGEGAGTDCEMMAVISSANIACGGHAGDEYTIAKTIEMALQHQVSIGAHPGFEDKENFGRKRLDISAAELQSQINRQLERFAKIADQSGATVKYVKAHGALANMAAERADIAQIVMQTVKAFNPQYAILALANSQQSKAAEAHGLSVYDEVFADRAYTADGQLASRSLSGAVLEDIEIIKQHIASIIEKQGVVALDGRFVPLKAHSICLHGDTKGAAVAAQYIAEYLTQQNIKIQSFI